MYNSTCRLIVQKLIICNWTCNKSFSSDTWDWDLSMHSKSYLCQKPEILLPSKSMFRIDRFNPNQFPKLILFRFELKWQHAEKPCCFSHAVFFWFSAHLPARPTQLTRPLNPPGPWATIMAQMNSITQTKLHVTKSGGEHIKDKVKHTITYMNQY